MGLLGSGWCMGGARASLKSHIVEVRGWLMTRSPDPIARFDVGWRMASRSDNDQTFARRMARQAAA
jgi:hypothetical protein